jgi:UDP-N-acetylmuramyl pentapeptide phosphotransferase/UDP-N-acetylglucosamine-1-phosphate transferase
MELKLLFLVVILSFAGTILVIRFASVKNIIAVPNNRSSHSRPIPKIGGISVIIVWYIAICICYFALDTIDSRLFLALICCIPVALISLLDDIIHINPWIRLMVHILSASAALWFLGGLEKVDFGYFVLQRSSFLNIFSIFGIVWYTNLFNFIDGIDGYLGSEVLFVCLAAFILTGLHFPLFLAAATAGFLILNWQPAKIFMGDIGSTTIGFTIAVFAFHYQNTNQSSILLWLLLTSLFWFDATITLIRRIIHMENILTAHKKHAYQRIVQSGFSHQKTVIIAMIINLGIFCLALFAIASPKLILVFLALDVLLLGAILKYVDRKFPMDRC